MFRPAGVGGYEGQVDIRPLQGGQFRLSLFGSLFEPLQGHLVLAKVDALLPAVLVTDPVHDTLVEVIATKVCVAVGRLHLEGTLT